MRATEGMMTWIKRLQDIRTEVAKNIFGRLKHEQNVSADVLLGVSQTRQEIQQALNLGANPNHDFSMDARIMSSRFRETIDPPQQMIMDLFDGGMDPKSVTPSGNTFLHDCVSPECLDVFIDAGCDPWALNRLQDTALYTALKNGWWSAGCEMIKRNFPIFPSEFPNQDKLLARNVVQMLHHCQSSNASFMEPILRCLMPHLNLNSFSQEDRVFLFDLLSVEAKQPWLEFFQQSFHAMAKPFHVPPLFAHMHDMEETYILGCYRNGDFDADVYTKEKHVDVEDLNGCTLLHYAVKHHMVTAVRTLVVLGADVHRKNHQGVTPLMMLHEPRLGASLFEPNNHHPDALLALMVDAGADPFELHPITQKPFPLLETHPPQSDTELHKQVSRHAYNALWCEMQREDLRHSLSCFWGGEDGSEIKPESQKERKKI